MTPETKERVIELAKWKLTIETINELVTILLTEKVIITNEKQVFDNWESWQLEIFDSLWELDIVRRSLDEARQAWYTKKAEELEALISNPVNVAERFEEIEKKRPFIM